MPHTKRPFPDGPTDPAIYEAYNDLCYEIKRLRNYGFDLVKQKPFLTVAEHIYNWHREHEQNIRMKPEFVEKMDRCLQRLQKYLDRIGPGLFNSVYPYIVPSSFDDMLPAWSRNRRRYGTGVYGGGIAGRSGHANEYPYSERSSGGRTGQIVPELASMYSVTTDWPYEIEEVDWGWNDLPYFYQAAIHVVLNAKKMMLSENRLHFAWYMLWLTIIENNHAICDASSD